MQQFTSLHLTVVFIPHHLLMIQLKQLADFVLIEITPLEGVLDYHKKLLISLLLGVGNYEINYNIEIRMYNFSRKLVVFFIIFFAQSSLGTNAIQLESQNLWNEKAQNGYVKLSNGLLIQWGKQLGSTATTVTIYMPLSFCNTDYIIQGCIIKDAYDGNVYTATPLINPTISSFKMDRNFGSSSGTGVSRAKYSWIAIGRWK